MSLLLLFSKQVPKIFITCNYMAGRFICIKYFISTVAKPELFSKKIPKIIATFKSMAGRFECVFK